MNSARFAAYATDEETEKSKRLLYLKFITAYVAQFSLGTEVEKWQDNSF